MEEKCFTLVFPPIFMYYFLCFSLAFNILVNVGVVLTYPILISIGTVLSVPGNAGTSAAAGKMSPWEELRKQLYCLNNLLGGNLLQSPVLNNLCLCSSVSSASSLGGGGGGVEKISGFRGIQL